MVAGETEAILAEQIGDAGYDNFLFGRKNQKGRIKRRNRTSVIQRREKRKQNRFEKKTRRVERINARRNSPTRIMRKERRSGFIKDLGTAYRSAGGATGIGAKIDALTPQLDPNYSGDTGTTASDYSVSVGSDDNPDKKSAVPKVALAIGGIMVLGIIVAIAMKQRNQPSN